MRVRVRVRVWFMDELKYTIFFKVIEVIYSTALATNKRPFYVLFYCY